MIERGRDGREDEKVVVRTDSGSGRQHAVSSSTESVGPPTLRINVIHSICYSFTQKNLSTSNILDDAYYASSVISDVYMFFLGRMKDSKLLNPSFFL